MSKASEKQRERLRRQVTIGFNVDIGLDAKGQVKDDRKMMKGISKLILSHDNLKDKCCEAQQTAKDDLKEKIANAMCA